MKEAQLKFTRFNDWVWRKLPCCREIVKLVTASMDRQLTWREWLVMKVHLYSCDSCINFLKQIKFIRSTLIQGDTNLGEAEKSVHLTDDAKTRMKKALESAKEA
jgi:hypothetical protein